MHNRQIVFFVLFCLIIQLEFLSTNGQPIIKSSFRAKRGLGEFARVAASGAVSAVAWHATNKAINKIVGG
ncbi:hypothetical protein niasHT_026918 [Heterodera trifolii]|uniref:Uncharacterized protein n=1 Tax=Heterodera trifolii TaxID=157864 RepID=A0ABD2JXX4_9BILA